jgi:hypothetical protein
MNECRYRDECMMERVDKVGKRWEEEGMNEGMYTYE